MEPSEENIKQQLIQFIKLNKAFYANTNFESYSLTQLVILKTEIEIELKHKYKR
jgi:hypothetical protein